MSKKKKPQGGRSAVQWNPPQQKAETADESFHESKDVASATECTGLAMHAPDTRAAAESLSDLYAVHEMKTQGNVGKDNPNNPKREKDFHRK